MFFIESDFPQQTGTNIINRSSSWINVKMWKTHVFLLDMSLCLFLTLLLYNYKKKQKLIIVNFMEIKACKGKIYLFIFVDTQ